MGEINRIEVKIDNTPFIMVGNESEQYYRAIANYIDGKISEIKKAKPNLLTALDFKTIYIAVNIASDLFKEKDILKSDRQTLIDKEKELEDYINEINKLTEENQLLKEKLNETQLILNNTKKEFNEYIDTFDSLRGIK